MEFSQPDRSSYYKGLLILMGRDRIIDSRERDLMLRVGEILDFDKRFCEAAIDELLRNQNITHDPVVFSDPEIARCFLRDAIRLALVDDEVHHHEFVWLRNVSRVNGFPDQWLNNELAAFHQGKRPLDSFECLKLQQLI